MKNIGLTSVTFRDKPIEEIAKIAKLANLNCLELGTDVHITDIKQCANAVNLCKTNQLSICSVGSYYKVSENDFEKFDSLCKTAKELNAPLIRIWLGTKSSAKTTASERTLLLDEVSTLAKIAATYKLTIAFEFHNHTYNDNADICVKFLEDLNIDNVKTLWQPLHNGTDELENLRIMYNYLAEIHVFSWDKKGRRFSLKHGKKLWTNVVTFLTNNNFTGNYILEFVKRNSEKAFYKDAEFLTHLLNNYTLR